MRKEEQHTTYKKPSEKIEFLVEILRKEGTDLTSWGSRFQTASEALVKVRCPAVDLSPYVGMVSLRCVADRRPLTPGLHLDTRSARLPC